MAACQPASASLRRANGYVADPASILRFTGVALPSLRQTSVGTFSMILGLILVVGTIGLLVTVGRGRAGSLELARAACGARRPPTRPQSDDHWCRIVLLGEAVFVGSRWLLAWFGFLVANLTYIPLAKERGLARRRGDNYPRH